MKQKTAKRGFCKTAFMRFLQKPHEKQDKYQVAQQVSHTIVLKATFLVQKDDASSFLLKN